MADYKIGDKNIKFKPGDTFTNSIGTLEYIDDCGKDKRGNKKGKWKCFCENKTIFDTYISNIKRGHSQSCGHFLTEYLNNKLKNPDEIYLINLYKHIKDKCYNINCEYYKNYGDRGIKMQEDWVNNRTKFINDILEKLGHRPSDKHSLDRINNDGDYEIKETNNLRWATKKEQNNNKRNNIIVEIFYMRGEKILEPNTRTLQQWEEYSGINAFTIKNRLENKWKNEKLLNLIIKKVAKNPKEYLHNVWTGIKSRCYNKKRKEYKNYGARGITMYEPWKNDFNKFKEDLLKEIGERPSSKHQLDRYPNKEGNYEPGNLRWATRKENNNNKTTNVNITINGITKTATQWSETEEAKLNGLTDQIISIRFKNNWSDSEILSPLIKQKFDIKMVEKIRKEKEMGLTHKFLMEKYKCSQDTIMNIVYKRGAYTK